MSARKFSNKELLRQPTGSKWYYVQHKDGFWMICPEDSSCVYHATAFTEADAKLICEAVNKLRRGRRR